MPLVDSTELFLKPKEINCTYVSFPLFLAGIISALCVNVDCHRLTKGGGG